MSFKFSPEQVVTALYVGVLNRLPDRDGLRSHVDALMSRSSTLDEVALCISRSEESRGIQGSEGLRDVTQFGELRHLLEIFMLLGVGDRTIVDVGARGVKGSNSFNLIRDFGWNGLLIEANPKLIDSILADFAGLSVQVVNCAIGTREGKMPFYIGVNDDVSSLLENHAKAWGPIQEKTDVSVRKLGKVLDENRISREFDILSLDIEGMDVNVLNDLVDTTDFRPRVIVIEASYDFRTQSLEEAGLSIAVQDHYDIVRQTRANLILVASNEVHKISRIL